MALANVNVLKLSDADRQVLEAWLVEFDQTWADGRLAARVRQLPAPGQPLRLPALVEMVKIDLERLWQRGRRVTIDAYLKAYPELGNPDSVPMDLLLAEYEVRQQFGAPDDIAKRYPRQADELRRLLEQAQQVTRRSKIVPSAQATPEPRASTHSQVRPRGARPPLPEQFGRYRIVKRLGRGGMGTVYLAQDGPLDRLVALKVPHFAPEDDPEILERFYREARAAATIEHPNICPVYDVGQVDGTPYLTMAYIDGKPLSEFIGGQPLAQRQVASLVRKLALALQEAHERKVVHRDLKPSNIMINQRREPVIMDFGLAFRSRQDEVRLTQSGAIVGTPAYMAPEQVNGSVRAVGPGCDIYSLGVILYELLTGELPFEGSLLEVMGQILTQEPRRPTKIRPDVDAPLEAICLKAMAKKVETRYSSMTELAEALAVYLRMSGKEAGGGEAVVAAVKPRPAGAAPASVRAPAPTPARAASAVRQPPVSVKAPSGHGPGAWPQRVPVWVWLAAGGGALAAVLLALLTVMLVFRPRGETNVATKDPGPVKSASSTHAKGPNPPTSAKAPTPPQTGVPAPLKEPDPVKEEPIGAQKPPEKSWEKYLPDDATAVFALNVKQLIDTALFKKHFEEKLKRILKDNPIAQLGLIARGIDPLKDISNLVGAFAELGPGEVKGLYICQGHFDAARMRVSWETEGLKPVNVPDGSGGYYRLYELELPQPSKPMFFAVVGEGTFVYSFGKADVIEACTKGAGRRKTVLKDKNLQGLLDQVDQRQTLWLAATGSLRAGNRTLQEELDVESVMGGITVAEELRAEVMLTAVSAAAAEKINEETIRGLVQATTNLVAEVEKQKELAPLLDVLRTVKSTAREKTVTITGHIARAIINKLLDEAAVEKAFQGAAEEIGRLQGKGEDTAQAIQFNDRLVLLQKKLVPATEKFGTALTPALERGRPEDITKLKTARSEFLKAVTAIQAELKSLKVPPTNSAQAFYAALQHWLRAYEVLGQKEFAEVIRLIEDRQLNQAVRLTKVKEIGARMDRVEQEEQAAVLAAQKAFAKEHRILLR